MESYANPKKCTRAAMFPEKKKSEKDTEPDRQFYGGSLRFKIWVTRGCYFTLADRLRSKSRHSTGAITAMSFYVVFISIISIVFPEELSEYYIKLISVFSILISVFIIIVTLMENARNFPTDAEHAFQVAHSLESLYNKYELSLERDEHAENMELRDEYNKILGEARIKHRSIDYRFFQISNRKFFDLSMLQFSGIVIIYISKLFLENWLYIAMITAPLPFLAVLTRSVFEHSVK